MDLSNKTIFDLLNDLEACCWPGAMGLNVEKAHAARDAIRQEIERRCATTLTSALAAEKARGERLACECREHRSDMGERDLVSDSCAEAMKAVDAARDLEVGNGQ